MSEWDEQKKILIIDDSRVILKALSIALAAHGYHPMTAEDGGQAISIVRQQKVDLILLDISFPPDVAHGGGVAWTDSSLWTGCGAWTKAKTFP